MKAWVVSCRFADQCGGGHEVHAICSSEELARTTAEKARQEHPHEAFSVDGPFEVAEQRRHPLTDLACIRWDEDGRPWILNRVANGFGERGYRYATLTALLADWAIEVDAPRADQHGIYLPARRAAA